MAYEARDNRREVPQMQLVAGNSNRPLAEAIAAVLKRPLTRSTVKLMREISGVWRG